MNGWVAFGVGALAGALFGAVALRTSETKCCKALGQVVRGKLVEDFGPFAGDIGDALNLWPSSVELLQITGKVNL